MGNAGTAEEVLAPRAAAGARLLRVERAEGPAAAPPRLVLVFETGAVQIAPDAAGEALRAEVADAPGPAPALRPADEEAPWWTILGQPLTRVAAHEAGALLLQFRPDAESPKILVLAPGPGAVRVRTLV